MQAGLTVLSAQSGFDGKPLGEQKGDHVFVCARADQEPESRRSS
jgi:hypothetical protein